MRLPAGFCGCCCCGCQHYCASTSSPSLHGPEGLGGRGWWCCATGMDGSASAQYINGSHSGKLVLVLIAHEDYSLQRNIIRGHGSHLVRVRVEKVSELASTSRQETLEEALVQLQREESAKPARHPRFLFSIWSGIPILFPHRDCMSLSCFLLFVCLAFLDLFNSQVTQPVTRIASFHHTGDKQQRMITNPSLKTTQVEVSGIFHLEQPLSQEHKLKSRKFFILSRCGLYAYISLIFEPKYFYSSLSPHQTIY
ncbi:uncharacterized protein LOC135093845 isoform X2 [Scylla paramamosain]|uniref:uncharacterized protein LOC135093845 isoform X2 n=1 Tax=Scylla paramamosain TaxID=85552 RepID=UPI00308300D9